MKVETIKRPFDDLLMLLDLFEQCNLVNVTECCLNASTLRARKRKFTGEVKGRDINPSTFFGQMEQAMGLREENRKVLKQVCDSEVHIIGSKWLQHNVRNL